MSQNICYPEPVSLIFRCAFHASRAKDACISLHAFLYHAKLLRKLFIKEMLVELRCSNRKDINLQYMLSKLYVLRRSGAWNLSSRMFSAQTVQVCFHVMQPVLLILQCVPLKVCKTSECYFMRYFE